MATQYPIGNRYAITTADNGLFPILGNAADGVVGTWSIHFVPDATFDGSFAVVGRSALKAAYDDRVSFDPIPFRAAYLNSLPSDYSVQAGGTIITSTSIIQVPSNGLSVALLVSCNAGFGYLYSIPLDGPSAL